MKGVIIGWFSNLYFNNGVVMTSLKLLELSLAGVASPLLGCV